MLACSVWYDQLHPGTFAELTNRAAGFPGNANYAALVANVLCASGLDFGYTRRLRRNPHSIAIDISILLSTFAVVTMTMSRSGLVNFGALCATFIFFRLVRSEATLARRSVESIILVITGICAASFLVWYASAGTVDSGDNRLTRFLNNQQVDDGSAGTRLGAVYDCIRHIEQSPWVGYGTGFARTMHELPHNIYLQQWVNNGLAGILSYILFLVSAFITFTFRQYRNGQALVLVIGVGGIFSHNIIDQRPFLILLGILLSHSYLMSRSAPQQLNILRLLPQRRTFSTHSLEQPTASEDTATLQAQ
jgi:O-antigen ligase